MTAHTSNDFNPYSTANKSVLAMKSAGFKERTPYDIVTRNISYIMSRWLIGTTDNIPLGSHSHHGVTPICLYSAVHAQILENELGKNFNVQLTYSPEVYEGCRIQVDSEKSYSAIVAILRRKSIPFNDFHWRESDILRVVVFGISNYFSIEHIIDTMLDLGYPVISVYKRNNVSAVNGALPIFVDVLKTNPGMQIFELHNFMSSNVTVKLFEKSPRYSFGIPNSMNLTAVKLKNCIC